MPSYTRLPGRTQCFLLTSILFLCLLFFHGHTARAATVDIMLVYDTTASTWVSKNGGIATFSEEAVNRMNQAMQNSDIDLTFRLVHAVSVAYTHQGLSDDLTSIQAGIGSLSLVHSLRNQYGADLVALLVDTGSAYGTVGLGYLLSSWGGSPAYGYTVSSIRAVAVSHTLTHEVGHNFGAHHAKTQNTSPGPNTSLGSYSAGWYFTGTNSTRYHTIMAYSTDRFGTHHQPAPLFSTPLVNWQGAVAGHSQDGDNARLIRETKNIIAAYRATVASSHTVNTQTGTGGSIVPSIRTVNHGESTSFTLVP
ncbi:metallopeptidase family M12-like protein, partial [Desulfobotulus alkaliphilus]